MFKLNHEEEERARRLHYDSFVFDYIPRGEPLILSKRMERVMEEGLNAGTPAPLIVSQMEMEQIREWDEDEGAKKIMEDMWRTTGVNCVSITLLGLKTEMDLKERLIRDLGRWQSKFDRGGYMKLVTSPKEADEASSGGKVGAIFNLQDPEIIGQDLTMLDALYNIRVRMLQLTYNQRNQIGDGCKEKEQRGLTHFGREVVERLNDLGFIIDLSHCGDGTVMDTIKYSQRPVAITHSFCRALSEHFRGKPDDILEALAEKDGYFGVLIVPHFLKSQGASLEDVLDHIDHSVKIMGAENVGIGTDWGSWTQDIPEPLRAGIEESFFQMGFRDSNFKVGVFLEGMRKYTDFINLTRGLVSRGYSDDKIKGILGGNFLKLWEKVVQ